MTTRQIVWYSVLGLAALYTAAILVYSLAPGGPPPERYARDDDPPARDVNAGALYDAYKANEVRADQDYRGALRVTGRIKDIGKDFSGAPYLVLGENLDNPLGVQAVFDSDAGLAALNKGDRVVALCRQNSGMTMHVTLRRCSLTR